MRSNDNTIVGTVFVETEIGQMLTTSGAARSGHDFVKTERVSLVLISDAIFDWTAC